MNSKLVVDSWKKGHTKSLGKHNLMHGITTIGDSRIWLMDMGRLRMDEAQEQQNNEPLVLALQTE
ncbi:MAG: hypothetical protein CM15mP49_13620 [Actinomycetota bacterium]|nr:MAG: hypothetical protein CM15mP49_13620 [Actinomycetota bacterium]